VPTGGTVDGLGVEVHHGDLHAAREGALRRLDALARDRKPVFRASTAVAAVGGRKHAPLDAGALEGPQHLLQAREPPLGDDKRLGHGCSWILTAA
jgi:hypothetical protein